MASPAVAINGITSTSLSQPDSPMSISTSSKRKRDDTDEGSPHDANQDVPGDSTQPSTTTVKSSSPVSNGAQHNKVLHEPAIIRDYFRVLQKFDADTGVLKRPLPSSDTDNSEPQAKRQKSEENPSSDAVSIEDKIRAEKYESLETLLVDVTSAVNAQLARLQAPDASHEESTERVDKLCAKMKQLKDEAQQLFRRELAYPSTERSVVKVEGQGASQVSSGRVSLLTYANIGGHKNRPLLTSLQLPASDGDMVTGKQQLESKLPAGISLAHAVTDMQPWEKPSRTLTIGELFPSPRNLPPLQPPKPTKSTTKSNVLTFYHPMLTMQSRYRSGTYYSQPLSTGQWLDYSNATPAAHMKTKQRERAQSLAGHRPSTTELEMSEMDTLFRRAFSSFAPCKDDTAALVPADQLGRMYWQRYGRRNLQRLITSEMQIEEGGERSMAESSAVLEKTGEVDEEAIKEVIDTWDDSLIDPSLSDALGQPKKSDEEKDVEDMLHEVSELIETLASYQRNRNLALPTSQDRFSADPPNGDMLRNGALSHQPTEEEMLTYQSLKAQLSLVISMLPPYAVARLNSDKLDELSVSTKIEIRTDDYMGVMEEDEQAARARQASAQAPTASAQQHRSSSTSHRTSSMSSSTPYNQYGGHHANTTGRTPMPATPQHYAPATPVRAQPSNMYRPTSAVPAPQPSQSRVRHVIPPPSAQHQQYGPAAPNGYGPGVAPQPLPRGPPSYGHNGSAPSPYNPNGVAGQARMQSHGGYNPAPSATPVQPSRHGYQPTPYGSGYSQSPHMPQQPLPQPNAQQMHPPQHQPPRSYSPYVNGAGQMASQQRTMSPQVGGQPQHHGYSPSPTPPQQYQQPLRGPQYGTPNQVPPMPPNGRSYSNIPPPSIPPQPSSQQRGPTVGVTGYHTVMGDAQQKQVLEQARQQANAQAQLQTSQQAQARHDAQSRVASFGQEAAQGNKVAGLGGIGLSGTMDAQRMAAMRAASTGSYNGMSSQSPNPPPTQQPARGSTSSYSGGGVLPPPANNNMSPPASTAHP